jgi:hypothetical protein
MKNKNIVSYLKKIVQLLWIGLFFIFWIAKADFSEFPTYQELNWIWETNLEVLNFPRSQLLVGNEYIPCNIKSQINLRNKPRFKF